MDQLDLPGPGSVATVAGAILMLTVRAGLLTVVLIVASKHSPARPRGPRQRSSRPTTPDPVATTSRHEVGEPGRTRLVGDAAVSRLHGGFFGEHVLVTEFAAQQAARSVPRPVAYGVWRG